MLFPNGKEKAFALSYDDGVLQDVRFLNLLNKYEIKCTFNLNSGLIGQNDSYKGIVDHSHIKEEDIKKVYMGHEIAMHTVTHTYMERLTESELINEVIPDKTKLEKICGYDVYGLAYPFGTYDENVVNILKKLGVKYARTVKSTMDFSLPENFLKWHPTCHHNAGELSQLKNSFLNESGLKLFYVWGHTYEFDRDKNWDMIERFLEEISGKKDVWYATNIEIATYIQNHTMCFY